MAKQFNWLDLSNEEPENRKPDLNDWRYYTWAGPAQWGARRKGIAEEPGYITPEYAARVKDIERSLSSYQPYEEESRITKRIDSQQVEDELTPGEKFARAISSVVSAQTDRPYGGMYAGLLRTGPEWMQDFTRAAITGLPQTVADVGGSIADWVTGNTGKNQDYTLAANKPQMYRNYGGVAQTVGSFAPDIAMAIGTFGATAPAAAAASASKIPGLARFARLAIGAEEAAPTAIKFMGRAISPAATRIERVAATLAGAVPTATNVLPEVTAGRMSPVEGVLSTGMGALGGTLAAGQWGGSRIKNVLSDMAVNMATQAGAEAVTLIPGGAEFDAAQAWKNMLYGAGLGTVFGVMNSAPLRGQGERVTLGAKPSPEMPTPSASAVDRFTGAMPKPVETLRRSEEMLFGQSTLAETATPEEAVAFAAQMRSRPASEMTSLRPTETGEIQSVSDAYLTGRAQEAYPGTPESAIAQAAEVERKAYANSLAAEFAQSPDALVRALDLEVAPGEITPENAQQILASKIENEWLVQAANGKGVAAVEKTLAQAGLRGAAQTPAPETQGQAALPAAPVLAQLPPAVAPELPAGARSMNVTPENMPPVIAGELPQARVPEYPAGTRPMAVTPENMPPVIAGELAAGTPEAVMAKVSQQVEQLKLDLGPDVVDAAQSVRTVANLTDSALEDIVPPDSPVYRAGKALEDIENTAREELAQVIPTQQVEPEAPKRERRKRIARTVAKTQAEAPVVEALAQAAPERAFASETAVASTDPRDAAVNKAGQKIAEWAETVRMNPGEELRGRRRTAQAGMNMVAKMLAPEGASIKLYPERSGGKVSAEEDFLSTVSGMTVPEFRAAVAAGQTDFAGGALRIEKVLPFSVREAKEWTGIDEQKQVDQKFIGELAQKYKIAEVGPEGRTYKVKLYSEGGFFIGSDNGGGIVLARKPKGPSLIDIEGNKPRIFKTEKEARAYMAAKKLKEDTGAVTVTEAGNLEAASRASSMLEKAASLSTNGEELVKILDNARGLPQEDRVADAVARNKNVSDQTFDAAINNPALRATVSDSYVQGLVDKRGGAQGESNFYNVTFPEKNIVGVLWDSFNASRNAADAAVKQDVAARRVAKAKVDRLYGTTEEIQAAFDDATNINNIYRELPDIAVELPTRRGRDVEADGNDAPLDEAKQIDVRKDIFRSRFKNTLDRSVDYFYSALEKSGAVKELGITRMDAKRVVMSQLLPGDFTRVGKVMVDRTLKPDVANRLDSEMMALLRRDERLKAAAGTTVKQTPLDELMNLGSDIPLSYFDKAYDNLIPDFVQAYEHVTTIARKAGIADPNDVWRYLSWQQGGPRPEGRKKLSAQLGDTFDDTKASEIAAKIDKVKNTDGDVYYALDQFQTFLDADKGANAFKEILDVNLLGSPKNPMMGLRNLPIIRNSTIFPALYALDQYVEGEIQDDQTYFGIPGSTVRKFLGDGQTTSYAMAGLFGVAVKGTNKAGQRSGFRARVGDTMRRTIDAAARIPGDFRSLAKMTPEQKDAYANNFMAENYPTIKPGTPEYDSIKAEKLRNEEYAAVAGFKISDGLNKLRSSTSEGTVGSMAKWFSDINNLGARSQFVKDYIVQPYVQLQSKTRQLMQSVEDPLNRILPDMVKKYKTDVDFWDAFWAMDYRMSGINAASEGISDNAIRLQREEIDADIKKEYFNGAETDADKMRWDDFSRTQKAIDSLRKEHYRALVAKSLGINSWNIETHYGELKIRKDATAEALGAAQEAKRVNEEQLQSLSDQYEAALKTQGKDGANAAIPGFAETRAGLIRAKREAQANIRQLGAELSRIEKRMTTIEELDSAVQKSIESRYMYRTRDGKANFVLRLQFDKETGLPSVRREYTSREEAELGRAEYLREAVQQKISKMPDYLAYAEKRSKLQTELDDLMTSEDFSNATDARIESINKQLDELDGYKSVSDMTDAEVFRFAQTYDMLDARRTVMDMRGKMLGARRGTATANLIVDQIMATAGPIKARIVSGTLDPESVTPNYVKGKGDSSLTDNQSGDVMMFTGRDAPTIDDFIDAIASRVDEPIDRGQIHDLLDKRLTYRDKTTASNNTKIETVWVDMAALRQVAEAYLDPAVPNLARRNNWIGYYDPDGKWDINKKMAYTIESLETMTAQIKNYNQWVALRDVVSDSMDWLNKWDINNGLREYVAGMLEYNSPAFNSKVFETLADYESKVSRYISMGTLFINVGSAIGNRIQGAAITFANGMQNATTKYGARETLPDGSKGEIKWFPSEMAADAFVYKQQVEGKSSWRTVEGFKWQGYFNPKNYGYGVAALAAPGHTLKYLANQDGFESLPKSQQGYWALVYDKVRQANLTQGGVVGSYAIREGVQTGTSRQKLETTLSGLTQWIETINNYGSVLTSAAVAENKFGLSQTDWRTLNSGQRNDVIDQALSTYRDKLAASAEARGLIQGQIADLRKQMESQTGRERDATQRLIDQKLARIENIRSDSDQLVDALTDYLVFNRGYEQGNWDNISKAKFERMILSAPGGRLAMTMTAPILRSMNSWQGMFRRAGATEGGTMAKIGRAAAPAMGAGILTVLLGGAASTLAIPAGVFLSDIASLAEMLYYYANNDENEKLDKVAPRQFWEKLAADMGPKYGIPSKEASEFVRKYWSEGLLRYSATDLNINAGTGIFDLATGGTPAQVILASGKSAFNFMTDVTNMTSGGAASPYDYMWAASTTLPTSAKRITQTLLNITSPHGAVKLDRDGNPIIDAFTGKPQYLTGVDIARQTFLGKPWSDTRSIITAREGGTPLYTANDRAAWANHLIKQVPYVKFGDEGQSAAFFERDAENLQRTITLKTRDYKTSVETSKNFINEMYKNNDLIDLGNGETRTFREILAETATAGIIPPTELKGKGAESVRNRILGYVDTWARSRAAAEAVYDFYGGSIPVEITDETLGYDSGYKFALMKLGAMYAEAYKQGRLRRQTRERLESSR